MERKSENLLLSYTYFIGEKVPKAVSVGFDSENFSPFVVITGENILKISALEWMLLADKLPEINTFIIKVTNDLIRKPDKKICKKKFLISPSCEIYIMVKNSKLLVTFTVKGLEEKSLQLSHREYINLFSFSNFISIILDFLSPLSPLVQDYCSQYEEKCIQLKNVFVENFFKPYISSPNLNYSRLFHEYPILQEEKIRALIQDEKRKNDENSNVAVKRKKTSLQSKSKKIDG